MENEIIEIKQADMLQAINRAEVDIQIATAKQYPRDLSRVLNQIKTYATIDMETAEDCFMLSAGAKATTNRSLRGSVSVSLKSLHQRGVTSEFRPESSVTMGARLPLWLSVTTLNLMKRYQSLLTEE